MKTLLTIVVAMCVLAGCSRNPNAEAERKLAEAEKKLQDANQALQDAQKGAEAARTSAEEAKAASQAVAARQTATKQTAGSPLPARDQQVQAPAATPASPAAPAPAKVEPPKPEPPKSYTVAAGTPISVRTTTQLSTKTNEAGSTFEASLAEPLVVDGYVVAKKGATVEGVVTQSDDGGRVKGKAFMTLSLRKLTTADGHAISIKTSDASQEAQSGKKKDAAKVGIATGIGAAIGAIAGGGRGAAIGAGAGAAGGTGVVLATKGQAAVVPAESILNFTLAAPITVQETRR